MSNELTFFWFPWCTCHYKASFYKLKVAELEASGEFWGVRVVCGQIQIKVAKLNGKTIWDKREYEGREKGAS